MQISTIEPRSSITKQDSIPLDTGGITRAIINMESAKQYQLAITINPKIGSEVYDFLVENRASGLRINHNGFDMAFYRKRGGTEATKYLNDEVRINYRSVDGLLDNTRLYPRPFEKNFIYSGTTEAFLNQLSPAFHFVYIGGDEEVPRIDSYETGVLDNFTMLNDVVKRRFGHTWRNLGIQNIGGVEKPVIQWGDFDNLDPLYEASNYGQSQNVFDEKRIFISDIKRTDSGEVVTHLTPYIDQGGGTDNGSAVFLTNPGADYILSDFPLVPSLSDPNIYEIFNKVAEDVGYVNGKVMPFSDTGGAEVEEGVKVTTETAQKNLYFQAVQYLKEHGGAKKRWQVDYGDNDHIILPNTRIHTSYRQVKTINGKKFVTNVDEITMTGKMMADLADFVKK